MDKDVPPPPAYLSPPTTFAIMTAQPGVHMAHGNIPVPPGNLVRYDVTPVRIFCQYCHAEVVTATNSKVGVVTFLACGGLVFVGCIAGCCLIPFCIDSLKDTVHSCPNCKRMVGMYRPV